MSSTGPAARTPSERQRTRRWSLGEQSSRQGPAPSHPQQREGPALETLTDTLIERVGQAGEHRQVSMKLDVRQFSAGAEQVDRDVLAKEAAMCCSELKLPANRPSWCCNELQRRAACGNEPLRASVRALVTCGGNE